MLFSAYLAQARQSRLGEVTWKPERCSWVQFCPGKGIVTQARMTLEQVCSLDYFAQARGFSLKLNPKKNLGLSVLVV